MRNGWPFVCVAMACGAALPGAAGAGVAAGQVDDFEDGTTQGWRINVLGLASPPPEAVPAHVATGGPAGAGDGYLHLAALGGNGPGSRLAVTNTDQWAGDYVAAGVTALRVDLINLGQSDLLLRLVVADPGVGPPTNVAYSTDAVFLPVGGGWMEALFPLAPADLTAGLGSVDAALSQATELRLYHSPSANYPNPLSPIPAVVANLGVDNLAAVPEPGAMGLTAAGLALLAGRATRRRPARGR